MDPANAEPKYYIRTTWTSVDRDTFLHTMGADFEVEDLGFEDEGCTVFSWNGRKHTGVAFMPSVGETAEEFDRRVLEHFYTPEVLDQVEKLMAGEAGDSDGAVAG